MARIYLVDDHVVVREAFASLLQAHGHVIAGQSDDPTTAVAEVRALAPDVLVLDLNLGMRSGFEVLDELRRRHLGVRVLVATMSAHARDVAEAVRHGVDGYVLKGSSGAELMRAIDALMAGQRYFQGRVADLAIEGLSARGEVDALAELSARERQVVLMVVRGRSSNEIGQELHLSPKTVDTYRSRLMAKLGVADIQGLVRFAVRHNLVSEDEP